MFKITGYTFEVLLAGHKQELPCCTRNTSHYGHSAFFFSRGTFYKHIQVSCSGSGGGRGEISCFEIVKLARGEGVG